jgi:uncharacterized membrane protein HdeD (DUF308 family)
MIIRVSIHGKKNDRVVVIIEFMLTFQIGLVTFNAGRIKLINIQGKKKLPVKINRLLCRKGIAMEYVKRNWWAFVLRGILAIAMGVILIAWPEATIKALIMIFGIFALLEGAVEVVIAIILASKELPFGTVLGKGLFGLLIGGILVSRPGITLAVVVLLIAIWMIATGILQLVLAFDMPPESGRGLVGFGGLISIIIGVLFLAVPLKTVYAAIVWGLWLIFLGIYTFSKRKNINT